MTLIYAPRALRDIDEILAYVQNKSPHGARNVSIAIEHTITICARNPRSGSATDRPDIFRWPLRNYRYTIFYRHNASSDLVEIVRVIYAPRIRNLRQPPDLD